jgi:hypothetical protein
MLGAAIQTGLDQQDAANKGETIVHSSTAGSQKRKLEVDGNPSEQQQPQLQQQQQQPELDEPPAKKMRTETI